MKSRIPQIITIVAIALIMSMAIPSSFAKYTGTEQYTINISKDIELPDMFEVYLYVANTQQTFTPNKTGYYAVVVKGGDGADGFVRDNSTNTFSVKGGTGGTVTGIYYLNGSDGSAKSDTLYIYPGTRGNRPTGSSTATEGTGGINAMSLCSGGSGNDTLSGATGLASTLSTAVASGGGGAASLVYLNGTSTSNILMIAGGGGAAGCQDDGSFATVGNFVSVKDAHKGGDGGSNLSSNTTKSFTASGTHSGTTYAGGDSYGGEYGDSKWGTAIGYGGSTSKYNSVGTGGTTKKISFIIFGSVPAGSGGNGNYFDSNGNGGSSDEYGGGGGGGFCGGGAGTGTSLNTGSGGGGGGSSFVAAKANNKNVAALSDSIYSSMLSDKASNLPAQKTLSDSVYTDAGDGYVIVKWIGEEL